MYTSRKYIFLLSNYMKFRYFHRIIYHFIHILVSMPNFKHSFLRNQNYGNNFSRYFRPRNLRYNALRREKDNFMSSGNAFVDNDKICPHKCGLSFMQMPYHLRPYLQKCQLSYEKFNLCFQPGYHWKKDGLYFQIVCLTLIRALSFPEETQLKVG